MDAVGRAHAPAVDTRFRSETRRLTLPQAPYSTGAYGSASAYGGASKPAAAVSAPPAAQPQQPAYGASSYGASKPPGVGGGGYGGERVFARADQAAGQGGRRCSGPVRSCSCAVGQHQQPRPAPFMCP